MLIRALGIGTNAEIIDTFGKERNAFATMETKCSTDHSEDSFTDN